MKEVITSVLILVLSHSIWSQGIHSTIYSPVQSGEVILPYAETDFLSIRMRGLGYQLHNVVEDTLTNLFRNPVSTYDLNKSLFIVNYENNEEPRRTVLWLQPVDYIILDGVITNPTGVIIEKPSGKQGLTQGTNLNASTSGIIQPYFNKDFYLSLGYWSPKLWGIVPADRKSVV